MSHGKSENEVLRKNLEKQLNRLLRDLKDLEDIRESLGESGYEESKKSITEQLEEFNERLQRLKSGNTTLIDEVGAMQLAIQEAISAAFKTPAVIQMFGKREPSQLREKLVQIDRDVKLGKLNQEVAEKEKGEILETLKGLGEKLESSELMLLEKLSLGNISQTSFVKIKDNDIRNSQST